jgi:hypothetical protein
LQYLDSNSLNGKKEVWGHLVRNAKTTQEEQEKEDKEFPN